MNYSMTDKDIIVPHVWDSVKRIDSSDTNVSKYVFERSDAVAEAVLYRYGSYEERTVLCCSTQSGCPIGCRFCGAGDSFVRSLDVSEIVTQTDWMFQDRGIDPEKVKRMQIMFMSMGEPLLNPNLSNVLIALRNSFPKAALLISTIGPRLTKNWDYSGLRSISREVPQVGLQFSVHESTDKARNLLIPYRRKLRLDEIAIEGEKWAEETGRRPFFNYCVHSSNNTILDADRLEKLFNPRIWEATISVICERDEHIAAANQRQRELAEEFQQLLLQRGFSTRMFDPAGQDDIGGGCGQLFFVQQWMKSNPELARPSVGRRLPILHRPT
jgi:23S rRNA (adenine2503-C2)-methyltransferase